MNMSAYILMVAGVVAMVAALPIIVPVVKRMLEKDDD